MSHFNFNSQATLPRCHKAKFLSHNQVQSRFYVQQSERSTKSHLQTASGNRAFTFCLLHIPFLLRICGKLSYQEKYCYHWPPNRVTLRAKSCFQSLRVIHMRGNQQFFSPPLNMLIRLKAAKNWKLEI